VIGSLDLYIDENTLTEHVLNDSGIQDEPHRTMCYHMVMYFCEVKRVLAEYSFSNVHTRYEEIQPPPFESLTRYFLTA